ncbi:glutamic acid-rich protein-like [Penaeus monodon]|uniref:glutamic acid-rich protein-like n=1 Tax=Penaeus monodon TaxID=6687 RepID=UPI0018A7605D|nr:glutamic acid-rich protein-like [Penaeus monodon]
MKAPRALLLALAAGCACVASAMRQVELDQVEPLQLSSFDGYKFGNSFGADGYYSFFYLLPTSSRSEQRTASGEVTGEYAFVAPEGDEFEFRYSAGDEGYRVESDALPVAPEDTDEVKKAKEEFFAAYEKALELAGSYEDYEESSEESSEEAYGEESDEDSSEESDEDDEDSEEEDSEEEEEEEEEKEEEGKESKVFPKFQSFARPGPGFGQKIRKPSYPYPYSR